MAIVWPKRLVIRGVEVVVESIEEMDELIDRYGSGAAVSPTGLSASASLVGPGAADTPLLRAFLGSHDRGLIVRDIKAILGIKGKVFGPLKAWGARVGLSAKPDGTPFVTKRLTAGRAYCLTEEAFQAAKRQTAQQ